MPSSVDGFLDYHAARDDLPPRCGQQVPWVRTDDCELAVRKVLAGTMDDRDRVVLHWIRTEATCSDYFNSRLRAEAVASCKGQA